MGDTGRILVKLYLFVLAPVGAIIYFSGRHCGIKKWQDIKEKIQPLISRADTPIKRLGAIFLLLSVLIFTYTFIHWFVFEWNENVRYLIRNYLSALFHKGYSGYFKSTITALTLFSIGIAMFFGIADIIINWIKTGATRTGP